MKQFKDVSFARSRRRMDDHVLAFAEGTHGVLLPEIRDDKLERVHKLQERDFRSFGGRWKVMK